MKQTTSNYNALCNARKGVYYSACITIGPTPSVVSLSVPSGIYLCVCAIKYHLYIQNK